MPIWYEEPDPNDAADGLLTAYVNGRLDAPLHVLVASHLALSPDNHAFVSGLELLKGAALEAAQPVPLQDHKNKFAHLLADIGNESAPSSSSSEMSIVREGIELPRPLADYIEWDGAQPQWNEIAPGIMVAKALSQEGKATGVLLHLAEGRTVEFAMGDKWRATLILQGGFKAEGKHYGEGALNVATPGKICRWEVDPGRGCLCFSVSDPEYETGAIS